MPVPNMTTTKALMKKDYFDNLVRQCTMLKQDNSGTNSVEECDYRTLRGIVDSVNGIFEPMELLCTDCALTYNTDNILFGIMVNPTIMIDKLVNLIFDEEDMQFNRFSFEIDSKLLDILTGEELAALIVEEIYNMVCSTSINNLRDILHYTICMTKDEICVSKCMACSEILIFAIKDSLRKITSILYKEPDEIGLNVYADAFNTKQLLVEDIDKKVKSAISTDVGVEIKSDLSVLRWALMVYKNIDMYFNDAIDTLNQAAFNTGSIILKNEIRKIIDHLNCMTPDIRAVEESTEEMLCEKSAFFAALKKNGLRQIEDDLYEYKVRYKNCDTTEEALYIIRQINSRISILDDYLLSNPEISDYERDRWLDIIQKFKDLREEVGKKKVVSRKSYGLFVDYDKLDAMDF